MHDLIKKASAYAQQAHLAQKYGKNYPYHKHLEDVYHVLIRFGFNEINNIELLVAAWLHDILEDTSHSYSDIKKEFGIEVAETVYCVTDELGRNRKERKQKTYPKIKSNNNSIILKVSDRIANVEFSMTQDNNLLKMYQKEHKSFEHHLRIPDHIPKMWEHLNKLMTS